MVKRFDSNGRYHSAIIFHDTLYLSGLTAADAGDDIVSQSKAVLEKLEKTLEKYGSNKEQILHADVYLVDQELVQSFNEIWDAWVVPGKEPTRACMIAKLGRPQILVEIVVTAYIEE